MVGLIASWSFSHIERTVQRTGRPKTDPNPPSNTSEDARSTATNSMFDRLFGSIDCQVVLLRSIEAITFVLGRQGRILVTVTL